MKKLLIPFCICLLVVTTATAQEKQKFQQRKIDKKELAQKLQLSEEQQQKMKAIHQEFATKAKTLKNDDNITRGEFKTRMKALHEQKKNEVNALLTKEQQQQLKELKKSKHKEKATARLNRLTKELQLTKEQQASVQLKQKEIQSQIRNIRENNSLAENSKKEQLKQLHKQQKDYLKSLLTAEQIQKLESLKRAKK